MISLPDDSIDNKFMARARNTLEKNFNLAKPTQLDNAVMYSNCLIALGYKEEAITCLKSFVTKVDYSGDEDVWNAIGQGLCLLIYLYKLDKKDIATGGLLSRLTDNDIMSDRCSRAVFLREDLDEHEANIEDAMAATQKYKIDILSKEILKFVYYVEMWEQFQSEVMGIKKSEIEGIIDNSYTLLKKAIEN